MFRVLCILLAIPLSSSIARAQLIERPLPGDKRVGILYRSAVGRTTTNTLREDEIAKATFAETEETLRRLGYNVMNRAEVITSLIESDVDCPDGVQNCSPTDVMRALDLGAVVLVALWWDRSPVDLAIEITSASAVGSAKGRLDGPIATRVSGLISAALEDLRGGSAVAVRINTLPIGAQVRIDGELIGRAPITAQLRPGAHEAQLIYPDYVTTSHHFEVPRGGEPMTVHVALERSSPRARQVDAQPLDQHTQPTPAWDYAAGAVLGTAGVVLLVSPILTATQDGECDDRTNNGSCEPIRFGSRATWQLVGGVAALAGGVFMIAATPIRASISTDGDSLHASVHGQF